MKKSNIGNPSGLRFNKEGKKCGFCNSEKDIIQFEREAKRNDLLPIIEIAFICKECAEKEDLIKESTEVVNYNIKI